MNADQVPILPETVLTLSPLEFVRYLSRHQPLTRHGGYGVPATDYAAQIAAYLQSGRWTGGPTPTGPPPVSRRG